MMEKPQRRLSTKIEHIVWLYQWPDSPVPAIWMMCEMVAESLIPGICYGFVTGLDRQPLF